MTIIIMTSSIDQVAVGLWDPSRASRVSWLPLRTSGVGALRLLVKCTVAWQHHGNIWKLVFELKGCMKNDVSIIIYLAFVALIEIDMYS